MRKFKCIKSYESGEWLTKGKIYTEDNGRFRYDDGWIDTTFDYDNAHFDDNNKVSDYLEEIKEDKKVDKYDLKKDKIAVLCDTDKKLTELYKLFNSKPNTSVALVCNPSKLYVSWDGGSNELTWDSIDYHELNHYTLITFEEFINGIVFENPKTFTITTSDTTTTLTDGTHTTSINRYYTDKHDDMVALEEVVKKYKSEIDEINRPTKGKDLIGVYIPEGTKFRVINVEPHRRDNYVCLDEYIGKVATFNSRGFTFENNWFHYSAIFEEDYMNAIDKKNGRLCWRYDEVEILWED